MKRASVVIAASVVTVGLAACGGSSGATGFEKMSNLTPARESNRFSSG